MYGNGGVFKSLPQDDDDDAPQEELETFSPLESYAHGGAVTGVVSSGFGTGELLDDIDPIVEAPRRPPPISPISRSVPSPKPFTAPPPPPLVYNAPSELQPFIVPPAVSNNENNPFYDEPPPEKARTSFLPSKFAIESLILLTVLLCCFFWPLVGITVWTRYDVSNGIIGGNGASGKDGAPGLNGTGFVYSGTWNSTANYVAFDVVNCSGAIYLAVQNNTGVDPCNGTATSSWLSLTGPPGNGTFVLSNGTMAVLYLGAYNSSFTYNITNVVQYNNTLYISTGNNNTNCTPGTNCTGWVQIGGGINGQDGAPGINGTDGTGFAFTGNWNSTANYTALQLVNCSGNVYFAVLNNTNVDPCFGNATGTWLPVTGQPGLNGTNGTGFTFTGNWNASTNYTPLQLVNCSGTVYFAVANNTNVDPCFGNASGSWLPLTGQPGLNGTNGTGFAFTGNWNASANYTPLQLVNCSGFLYVAVANSTGVNPCFGNASSSWLPITGQPGLNGTNGLNGTGFVFTGNWNASANYTPFETVNCSGILYVAVANSSGVNPCFGNASGSWLSLTGPMGLNATNGTDGLGFSFTGNWNSTANYTTLQIVNCSGILYVAVANNTNVTPCNGNASGTWLSLTGPSGLNGTNGTDGLGFSFTGNWNSTANYTTLQIVNCSGILYVAVANNTNVTPCNGNASGTWLSLTGPSGLNGTNGTGFSFVGTWNSTANYTPFQVVNESGVLYFALVNNTATDPANSTGVWERLTPFDGINGTVGINGTNGLGFSYVGTWNSTANYSQFQVVNFSGSSYFAIVNNTGAQPDISPSAWFRITGVNGTDGMNGIGFSFVGVWNSTANYTTFQVVNVSGVTYYALINNTGVMPGTNSSVWSQINGNNGRDLIARGLWNSTAQYNPLDIVLYNGTAYLALVNNTDVNPQNDTNFTTWVPIGAEGARGIQGQIGQPAFTDTTATFTVPPINSSVVVSVLNNSWAAVGEVVLIQGAGYYLVDGFPDGLSMNLTNLGVSGNAIPGTSVASGTLVTPSGSPGIGGANGIGIQYVGNWNSTQNYSTLQVVNYTGGLYISLMNNTGVTPGTNGSIWFMLNGQSGTNGTNGTNGTSGFSAYAVTTATFTVPAANAAVTVAVNNSGFLTPGEYAYIAGAGYYIVSSVPSSASVVFINTNSTGNAIPGTSIGSGALVTPSGTVGPIGGIGPQGIQGLQGNQGQNAFTTTTAPFTVPALGSTVTVSVVNTSWIAIGQPLYVNATGTFIVTAIPSTTTVTLNNTGSTDIITPGSTVPTGQLVTPGGISKPGTQGPAGQNAFTITNASFVMPPQGSSVLVSVQNSSWMAPGQIVYVTTAGYFLVANVPNTSVANLTNIAYPGNAANGTNITSGQNVSPGGLIGPMGTSFSEEVTACISGNGTISSSALVQLNYSSSCGPGSTFGLGAPSAIYTIPTTGRYDIRFELSSIVTNTISNAAMVLSVNVPSVGNFQFNSLNAGGSFLGAVYRSTFSLVISLNSTSRLAFGVSFTFSSGSANYNPVMAGYTVSTLSIQKVSNST